MNEEHYFERIEAYLNGTLTVEELNAFEQDLKNDPNLQEELETHQLAMNAIELEISNDLKSKMNTWLDEEEDQIISDPSKFKIRTLFKPVAVAASILLLVSAGLNWFSNAQYGNQAIAGELPEAYVFSGTRSVQETEGLKVVNLEAEITKAFQEKDFARLNQFNNPMANYYKGLLAVQNNEYQKAMVNFDAVPKTNEYFLHARMEYIKTALLNDSFDQKAKQYLEELKDGQNDYSKIATALYEKLNTPLRRMFVK